MADKRHGDPAEPIDMATWLGDDPALALVTADLSEYAAMDRERCECEGLCRCDEQDA